MRIKKAHIFGFGKWIDTSFSFNEQSLTSYYGPNEAGKSTLQQFILYMLFGLPPRKLKHYKPKSSSRVGGTLTVTYKENPSITIKRIDNKLEILLPDGNIVRDESWLIQRMYGLNRTTYEAIYAFSALDLKQFQQMKKSHLSDLLFSISLTGSAVIYSLEKQLQRKLDELFKKTGRVPMINKQIQTVVHIDRQLMESETEVLSYNDKITELQEKEREREQIDEQIMTYNQKRIEIEKTLHLLPQIYEYMRTSEQLQRLQDESISFPEAGILRYEQLKERLLPLQSKLEFLNKELSYYKEQRDQAKTNALGETIVQRMEQIMSNQSFYEKMKDQLKHINEQIIETGTLLKEKLQALSIDRSTLDDIEFPFHIETSWSQFIAQGNRLKEEKQKLQEQREQIKRRSDLLESQYKTLEKQFVGEETYDSWQRKLKEQDRDSLWKQWVEIEYKEQKQTLIFLSLGIFALLLFGIIFQITSLHIVNIVLFGLLIRQGLLLRKNKNSLQEKKDSTHSEQLRNLPTEQQFAEQTKIRKEIGTFEQTLTSLRMEQLQWEEKNHHLMLREKTWLTQIEEERRKYPLLKRVEVDYWLELYTKIKDMKRERLTEIKLEKEKEDLIQSMKEIEENMMQLGELLDLSKDEASFSSFEQILVGNESTLRMVEQNEQYILKLQAELDEVKGQKDIVENEIEKLFSKANVTTEENFYKAASNYEDKKQLQEQKDMLYQQLITVFSEEQFKAMLEQSLSETELENKKRKITKQRDKWMEKQEKLQEQIIALQYKIEQLESSEEYSERNHLFHREKEKLEQLATKWATYKLAQSILTQAKKSYQQKYMDDVLIYTSTYFSYLTDHKYKKVYPPEKNRSFQVEGNDHIRYNVEELSKGTVDQLYVALRFAISKVMGHKMNVPIMIDDAFIHFDSARMYKATELLQQIAEEQQVIVYTCRQDLAKHLQAKNLTKIVTENI